MKTFQKFPLLPVVALAFNLHAATNDTAPFSGTVVDAQGRPVAGATVEDYQYASRTGSGPVEMEVEQHATTDDRGAFEFPVFHGQAVVLVTKAGFAPGWRTWYAAAPEESQKIMLSAASALAGEVVDDAGRPVAGPACRRSPSCRAWRRPATSGAKKLETPFGTPPPARSCSGVCPTPMT